jgi:hypothetical protein
MVRLFPAFFPLLLVCGLERAEFKRKEERERNEVRRGKVLRTMCGSRTGGWSLPCVMSD